VIARILPRSVVSPGALLVVCVVACPAAELVIRDVTLGITAPPAGFAYEISDSAGTRSGDDAFDAVSGLAVGLHWSFAGPGQSTGLVVGGRLVSESSEFVGGGTFTGLGADLDLGYGWAISDRLSLVPMVSLSPRQHAMDVEAAGSIAGFSASGFGYAYGARAVLAYAIADVVVLGLEAGYRQGSASLSGDRDVQFDTAGLTYGLVLGWRFAATPMGLE
jgi:hypothetical protein